VKSVNLSNTPHNIPYADWQILGELDLPKRTNRDDNLRAWLAETLSPLELHATLLSKILGSAEETLGDAMASEHAAETRTMHLMVYAARQSPSNGQSWGFFWVEKMDDSVQEAESSALSHSILLYLYLEG
jgi:hypothetical protein